MVDLSGAMASQDARPLGPAPHETEPDVDNPTILYSYPPSRSAQKCEGGYTANTLSPSPYTN